MVVLPLLLKQIARLKVAEGGGVHFLKSGCRRDQYPIHCRETGVVYGVMLRRMIFSEEVKHARQGLSPPSADRKTKAS